MTDRFDEVRQLAELERKATRGPWGWEDWQETANEPGPGDYWLVAPPETRPNGLAPCCPTLGNDILADEERESSEEDRQLIADLRNAAPWLLEAAACFQPGDVRCLKAIMGIMRAATGPETDSEELDCLRRLQEAASLLEAEDVNP